MCPCIEAGVPSVTMLVLVVTGLVGRCRLTPGFNSSPRAFFQHLNLTYDKLISNVAFNCNVRHYRLEKPHEQTVLGGAVQVDPGLLRLTPRLLSTLESNIREPAFRLCFQLQPAPLQMGVVILTAGRA